MSYYIRSGKGFNLHWFYMQYYSHLDDETVLMF